MPSKFGFNPDDDRIKALADGIWQRVGAITHPCFWGSFTKEAAEVGVGGSVTVKIGTGAIEDLSWGQKVITGVTLLDKGKATLGPFYGEITKPVSKWWSSFTNRVCTAIGG